MSADPFSRARLVALLAPALGDERGEQVIAQALSAHHLRPPLSDEQTRRLLTDLGLQGGTVGAAARLALQRLASTPARAAAVPTPTPSGPALDIVSLLAPSLGVERAADVVRQACHRLGLLGPPHDRAGVLALLDQLDSEPGLVGVTTRFVKARLLLAG
ncbi:MAG: hypothetical protein EOO75_15715 [Myxococcales bacterium]|nr:MAG: hypothetical protein EOO75_15715 [Myxococcales bacterium]